METKQLFCPGCDQPVELLGNACSLCGLEFQKMCIFIEEALELGENDLAQALQPISPRIGEFLVDLKIFTPKQLEEALQEQHRQMTQGQRRRLGHILAESGLIDLKTLDYYLSLHTLQLKLQLIVGHMNHARASDRSQIISGPINEMKENLLKFVTAFNDVEEYTA